ncbi:MAG: PIN domain-containing protein [Deltaproteobacteria bacterium]|nr:PIN domain-containing protein [Deltaproteobacteria bacterium]
MRSRSSFCRKRKARRWSGVTEFTFLLARRVREGSLRSLEARRLHQRLLRDLAGGEFLRVDGTESSHREAERLLLVLGERAPLRAADALHLALATMAGARTLFTFDRRLASAATALGSLEIVGR